MGLINSAIARIHLQIVVQFPFRLFSLYKIAICISQSLRNLGQKYETETRQMSG